MIMFKPYFIIPSVDVQTDTLYTVHPLPSPHISFRVCGFSRRV
jgi:hypothetical protein